MINSEYSTKSTTTQDVDINSPSMGAAALRLAAAGWYVFPLHNAIFDANGHVTGCTCEAYRHSEECRRDHPHLYLTADQHCEQPGKCPRVKWREKSTRDPEQIRKWWKAWPSAGIGIDCGASGLLIVDLDSYKTAYAGASLALDEATVTTVTGGGGRHVWYRMPHGCHYGNRTGSLPAGIDIRGEGGYIVTAPSLHKSGRRYAWAAGRSPWEIEIAPLPPALAAILEAAQQRADAPDVHFGADVDAPDLDAIGLPDAVRQTILQPPAGDRSATDFAVVAALVRAGLDDGAIRAVYRTYPIGSLGKYAQRGDPYLALTIGNVRAKVSAGETAMGATLAQWRSLVNGPAFVERLRAAEVRKPEGHRALMLALVQLAEQYGRLIFVPGLRKLGELAGAGKNAVQRRLGNLKRLGLLTITPVAAGLQVDLRQLVQNGTPPSDNPPIPTNCGECPGINKFEEHMADDVFSDYPHHYAARHWPGRERARALGPNALAIWDAIDRYGAKTILGLVDVTGLGVYATRAAVRKLAKADLLIAWKVGRALCVDLHPNIDERIEELREKVATYGIGEFRSMRNDEAAAAFAEKQRSSRAKLDDAERRRWAERRDRADAQASAKRDHLEGIGFVVRPARISVDAEGVPNAPKPQVLRFDAAEEWRSRYKDIYDLWQELEGDYTSKLVQMMYLHNGQDLDSAGWAKLKAHLSSEVQTALSLAQRVGRLAKPAAADYYSGAAQPKPATAQPGFWGAPTVHWAGAEVAA